MSFKNMIISNKAVILIFISGGILAKCIISYMCVYF